MVKKKFWHLKNVLIIGFFIFLLCTPIGFIILGTTLQFGYEGPIASFYSIEHSAKNFVYTKGEPAPNLTGSNGVFNFKEKTFLFDYENVETIDQDNSLFNSMDIAGHLSNFQKLYLVDIASRYGIPTSYITEKMENGKTITVVSELQLWIYQLEVTFTGLPDGKEKDMHNERSWEPANILSNLDVGIALNYNQGIVSSNANETYVLFLLAVTSQYETNDGDKLEQDVGTFNTYGKQEVDAVLSPAGTGVTLPVHAIVDGYQVGPNFESMIGNYISGIDWLNAESLERLGDVYFLVGINRYQCAFRYTWCGNGNYWCVGPKEVLQPEATLTFEIHMLVIGNFIFELPYEEIPDFDVDIDLHEEVDSPNWLWNLLMPLMVFFGVCFGIYLFAAWIKRPRASRTDVNVFALKNDERKERLNKKRVKFR